MQTGNAVGEDAAAHGIPGLHHWVQHRAEKLDAVPGAEFILTTLVDVGVGMLVGVLALLLVIAVKRALSRRPRPAA